MGLKNFGEGIVIRKVLEEFPMFSNAFQWLTDPTVQGRKRGIAAALLIFATMLQAGDATLHKVCATGDIVGAVCNLKTDTIASGMEITSEWLNKYVEPGAQVVGSLIALWGLIHARQKAKTASALFFLLLLLPGIAFAQEATPSPAPVPTPTAEFNLANYLRDHAYFAGGSLRTDGETKAIYELRFVDDFPIAAKTRAAARVSLFSLTRAGEQAPAPKVPLTLSEATSAYSDGEVWLSVYRELKDWVSLECMGGVTFKMASLSGSVGNPLDGTKAAIGCGPRFRYQGNHVSVLVGHYGPVSEGDKVLGPVPNVLFHAYIPLKFLGQNTAFTPDAAIGAAPPLPNDPDQRRQLKQTIRLLISSRF